VIENDVEKNGRHAARSTPLATSSSFSSQLARRCRCPLDLSAPLLLTLINLSNRMTTPMHSLIASSSIHLSSPLTTYTSSSSQKHLASSFLLADSALPSREDKNKHIWPLSLLLPHFIISYC